MRIVIVGTAYPLRGGIAHYVALLSQTLVKRGHDVKKLSRSRSANIQSSSFQENLKEEAGDKFPRGVRATAPPTEIIIDSINPLTWRKSWRRIC